MRLLLLLVVACGSTSEPERPPAKPKPTVDVPEVKDVGEPIAYEERGMTVLATKTDVVIDGQAIAQLDNGAFAATALEGGALGVKVERLTKFTEAWIAAAKTKGKPVDEVGLLLDRTLTYRMLMQLMFSIKSAGVKRFALVAYTKDDLISLPIVLPDKKVPTDVVTGRRTPSSDLAKQIEGVDDASRKGRVTVKAKSVTPALSLTADAMLAKILSAYIRGVERCAKATKRETVTLGFTVTEQGRATKPKVSGTTPSEIDCFGALIEGWRFSNPKAADGSPGQTIAEITLVIEPVPPEDRSEPMVVLRGVHDPVTADTPPKMVVSVTDKQLSVWSFNALEGTLTHPKLAVPLGPTAIRAVQKELEDIVRRRWQGKPRPPESREIIVMAQGTTSMQTVAELMFAVRQTRERVELFPDIVLSMGFE